MARTYLQDHHTHFTQSFDDLCPCFTKTHRHIHWLIHLVFKIHTLLLVADPKGFTLMPLQYLKNLTLANPYIYKPASNRIRLLESDNFQPAIDLLKSVLYQWLNIPSNRDAEIRSIIVNQLYNHLGAGALLLPGVWEMCYRLPKWIFASTSADNSAKHKIVPIRLFSACIQALPAASPDSLDYQLLNELWGLFMKFTGAIRGGRGTRVNLQLYDGQDVELNPVLAESRLQLLVQFLKTSLKAAKNELEPSHRLYERLVHPDNADFFMPLREYAPSRTNLRNQQNGPLSQLDKPIGLFNLLVFRVLSFNTPASRSLPYNFTIATLNDFRKSHTNNQAFFHNPKAYGNKSPAWTEEGVMERYWETAHHIWPKYLKDMQGTNLHLQIVYLKLTVTY